MTVEQPTSILSTWQVDFGLTLGTVYNFNMTYLAIDPGYEKLGYCVFCEDDLFPYCFKIIESGTIKTKRVATEKRIFKLYQEILKIIKKHQPKKIILEELFFFKNQKTMVKVAMIHGVINLLAAKEKISPIYLSPLEIKQSITGYGRADKKGVHKMLLQQIDLAKEKKEDDEIDAIACGLTYLLKSHQLNHG